ncbi:MAG: YeeE/YedE family protein [Deltaproteobacteria bacterium]|nr:YeeE/YedE family protein [Deltaproteobacteria bacterium]
MEAVATGLFVGVLFGFVLQRGRFCMNSAFRDAILLKDNILLKTVFVALLVELVGFSIMDMTGAIAINPKPFWWGANLLGSFVFGIGMVLAGGCASGITYRTGEGMVGAMTAVLGLATAGFFTAAGFLKPFKANLQAATTVSGADGSALTLHGILGMNYTTLALIIFIIAVIAWYIIAKQNKEECEADPGWGWLNTGILVGIIGILAFPLSAAAGRNYPLGITAGWINIVQTIFTGGTFNWVGLLIIGIVIGGLIAAVIAKEFKFRVPKPMVLVQTFAGGLLMGFGAVTSGGCNIGHLLSGIPQLSLGSILAGISIVLGAWAASYVMFVLPQKKDE